MKSLIKDTLILFVITLVSGLLLGGVYYITKEPIAKQEKLAKDEANRKVFADAKEFEVYDNLKLKTVLDGTGYKNKCVIDEILCAKDGDKILGYVISTTSKEGYGGDISMVVGIKNDGTVNGISILSISETAGLGMNANKPEFYEQYANKKVEEFVVTKNGAQNDNEIDAISSATITSEAMTDGVNSAIQVFNLIQMKEGVADE